MESSLKRKDTTKGPPLRILSLDGGGVRGYSIFIILQEIMHRTFVEIEGRAPHRNEIPKPADHFDLIVGTGTGGLIALMLGRLRLDIETCKELYVRLTRMVFETDKTILGIPTRPTLFKASRLEDAIKEAVREHTLAISEGKDSFTSGSVASSLSSVAGRPGSASSAPRRHSSNASVVSFSARSPAAQIARPYYSSSRGDPNALLYDSREFRTKTVVTAVYKGAPRGEEPVMLRSYDSRREPAPEFDCRIWEAGRATCAIGLAFKPIQIGQSVFHDDGTGTFNPSPQALDEATVNEWPGRDVGVFISVGTGKRPRGSDQNNPMWYDGFLGEFAEARRRLISKIEGCEKIHDYMQREHLLKRGVNAENYYRLNVEVGVGEFGMNEWGRLAEISTSTKRYLSRTAERSMVQSAAAKLAKINRANERYNLRLANVPEMSDQKPGNGLALPPAPEVFAVELPGDMPSTLPAARPTSASFSPRQSYDSGIDRLSVPAQNGSPSPRSSSERFSYQAPASSHQHSPIAEAPDSPVHPPPPRQSAPLPHSIDEDRLLVSAPTPEQWRNASSSVAGDPNRQTRNRMPYDQQQQEYKQQLLQHQYQTQRIEPPPLPPKTPLPDTNGRSQISDGRQPPVAPPPSGPLPPIPSSYQARPSGAPYPVDDDEAPPPPVNKARKPEYRRR
ncbi:hypothetical protein SBRCBS47491_008758 [Sporothrix bragantina]|uniref:PNPLA domain-containing protein n=1 Tax=Sporothrix bragantina TaxID=671064 RepID=A0ABP0CP10_9PEZI